MWLVKLVLACVFLATWTLAAHIDQDSITASSDVPSPSVQSDPPAETKSPDVPLNEETRPVIENAAEGSPPRRAEEDKNGGHSEPGIATVDAQKPSTPTDQKSEIGYKGKPLIGASSYASAYPAGVSGSYYGSSSIGSGLNKFGYPLEHNIYNGGGGGYYGYGGYGGNLGGNGGVGVGYLGGSSLGEGYGSLGHYGGSSFYSGPAVTQSGFGGHEGIYVPAIGGYGGGLASSGGHFESLTSGSGYGSLGYHGYPSTYNLGGYSGGYGGSLSGQGGGVYLEGIGGHSETNKVFDRQETGVSADGGYDSLGLPGKRSYISGSGLTSPIGIVLGLPSGGSYGSTGFHGGSSYYSGGNTEGYGGGSALLGGHSGFGSSGYEGHPPTYNVGGYNGGFGGGVAEAGGLVYLEGTREHSGTNNVFISFPSKRNTGLLASTSPLLGLSHTPEIQEPVKPIKEKSQSNFESTITSEQPLQSAIVSNEITEGASREPGSSKGDLSPALSGKGVSDTSQVPLQVTLTESQNSDSEASSGRTTIVSIVSKEGEVTQSVPEHDVSEVPASEVRTNKDNGLENLPSREDSGNDAIANEEKKNSEPED